jgi:hypothetical protein
MSKPFSINFGMPLDELAVVWVGQEGNASISKEAEGLQ